MPTDTKVMIVPNVVRIPDVCTENVGNLGLVYATMDGPGCNVMLGLHQRAMKKVRLQSWISCTIWISITWRSKWLHDKSFKWLKAWNSQYNTMILFTIFRSNWLFSLFQNLIVELLTLSSNISGIEEVKNVLLIYFLFRKYKYFTIQETNCV